MSRFRNRYIFLLVEVLDALTTINQVTIARVYNWDVHQRRLRQASPKDSWIEFSLPPSSEYGSIPNSLTTELIVMFLFARIVCALFFKFVLPVPYSVLSENIYCGRKCYILLEDHFWYVNYFSLSCNVWSHSKLGWWACFAV